MADEVVSASFTLETDDDYGRPSTELDNDALMLRFKDWWRHDYPRSREWHKHATQAFKFRAGDQWKDEDQAVMEDLQKRACLVFNQIDPVVDAVAGAEVTNRQEVRYIPRQLGNAPVNETLTEAARWFRDECDAEFEDSAAFTDAITTGMGWTETRLEYEENPDGDPKVERVDPLEMIWDGSSKQANLLDARRIMRVRREMPLNEAREKWPKDAEGNVIVDDADYNAAWAVNEFDKGDEEVPYERHFPGEPLEHESAGSRERRTVSIVQIQWYEREEYYRGVLADPATGQQNTAELTPDEHERAMVRADELGHAYKGVKQTRRVYFKAYIGGRVLELTKMIGPSKTPAGTFSLLCITGKWDRNKGMFYGLVKAMEGPQTFANKWLSTAVEMLARGAKGGLMLEEGAVADVEKFENDWAMPGSNSYFRPGALSGGKAQPKPQTQFPSDFMQMTQFAISSIRDVTGVNVEKLGLASGTPSGGPDTASQEYQRRQGATIILAPLFDSLRRYRRNQGRFLLWIITEFLSDGRLVRIVGQEGDRYVPLIHQPGVLKYDVIVDDAPSSPSQKEMVWQSMVTMMPLIQSIQPPPPVIMALLEYSPLPASVVAKVKQAMQQVQQQQQQNPQPNPMQLIMIEKQQAIDEEKQKSQIRLTSKQQENQLDLAHKQALARIDIQGQIAKSRVAAWAKAQEARMTAAANGGEPAQSHPIDQAVQDGLAAGIRTGVSKVAANVTVGQFPQESPFMEDLATQERAAAGGPAKAANKPAGKGKRNAV